ncbi:HprK-related kinase A [Vibrio alfacsensis]|uniref:HprK-related kinase A n=1 Tax=Vibrio alfacsensis TaxID=1074311 RepID=UPI001BF0F944|nr:HprK-related kinase A [Vibrio alfacsensis]WQE79093.1 HprK-related kinase A [Vibrio alfacsensis]BCN27381.1 HPr kinase [Vibrio alfacsensis]
MFLKTEKHLLQVGGFTFEIESNVSSIHDYLFKHYQHNLCHDDDPFIDFSISIKHGTGLRRFLKPQVEFFFNHLKPFKPLPLDQAHALLEWGMNWVISTQAHQYLIIHAASLEKNGKGIIISAPSGSGKSTLCAYLASQGWRLLSDELALIDVQTLEMHGMARPMNLKNQSIEVMRPYYDQTSFSKVAVDTHKGTVCLLRPPFESTKNAQQTALPRLLVFVNYTPKEKMFIEPIDKPTALTEVIQNSFNFGMLNKIGFQCAKKLVKTCDAVYIEYSDFEACELALAEYMEENNHCEQAS